MKALAERRDSVQGLCQRLLMSMSRTRRARPEAMRLWERTEERLLKVTEIGRNGCYLRLRQIVRDWLHYGR